MEKPNFNQVDPDRRAETARRVAAIKSYLVAPGRRMAERQAAALGLHHAQFYNLVRAWRLAGRAEDLAGATRMRNDPLAVTPDQARVIDAVIARDPRSPARDMVNLAIAEGEASGLTMPHREMVVRYVGRHRPRLLPAWARGQAELIVDHTVLGIPVRFADGAPRRPLATVVIDERSERVVELALSDGQPTPRAAAAALRDACTRGAMDKGMAKPGRILVMHPKETHEDWKGFVDALSAASVDVRRKALEGYSHGLVVEALLGRRANGIMLHPRLVTRPSRDPQKASALPVMSQQEAEDFARARLVGGDVREDTPKADDHASEALCAALSQWNRRR